MKSAKLSWSSSQNIPALAWMAVLVILTGTAQAGSNKGIPGDAAKNLGTGAAGGMLPARALSPDQILAVDSIYGAMGEAATTFPKDTPSSEGISPLLLVEPLNLMDKELKDVRIRGLLEVSARQQGFPNAQMMLESRLARIVRRMKEEPPPSREELTAFNTLYGERSRLMHRRVKTLMQGGAAALNRDMLASETTGVDAPRGWRRLWPSNWRLRRAKSKTQEIDDKP